MSPGPGVGHRPAQQVAGGLRVAEAVVQLGGADLREGGGGRLAAAGQRRRRAVRRGCRPRSPSRSAIAPRSHSCSPGASRSPSPTATSRRASRLTVTRACAARSISATTRRCSGSGGPSNGTARARCASTTDPSASASRETRIRCQNRAARSSGRGGAAPPPPGAAAAVPAATAGPPAGWPGARVLASPPARPGRSSRGPATSLASSRQDCSLPAISRVIARWDSASAVTTARSSERLTSRHSPRCSSAATSSPSQFSATPSSSRTRGRYGSCDDPDREPSTRVRATRTASATGSAPLRDRCRRTLATCRSGTAPGSAAACRSTRSAQCRPPSRSPADQREKAIVLQVPGCSSTVAPARRT